MTKTKGVPEAPNKITSAELKKNLTLKVKEGFLCVLTGLPGSGKSYLTRRTLSNKAAWLILEDYGETRGNKYISSPPEGVLKSAYVISGTADNAYDTVLKSVSASRSKPLNGIALYYVMPDHQVFVKSNDLKSKADTPFAQYFAASAKLSEKAMERSALRQYDLWVAKLSAYTASHDLMFEPKLVLNTYDGQGEVKAWDEDAQKGGKNDN